MLYAPLFDLFPVTMNPTAISKYPNVNLYLSDLTRNYTDSGVSVIDADNL